ncbi:MAG: hypothetical protein K2O18_18550 [Oscillospiraceae bacterium]|nr:hypothetical protein [Oscillospiraceae bacterium]
MEKILAAVSLVLSAAETALGAKWLACAAEEREPKRIFYGIVLLINAVMHITMSFDILSRPAGIEDGEWDDFDGFED